MAKRVRLTPDEIVISQGKRTKISHQESGVDISEEQDLLPSPNIEETLIRSNDKPALDKADVSPLIPEKQEANGDIATAQQKEFKSPTPIPRIDNKIQEIFGLTSKTTQASVATSEITTHQRDNRNISRKTQQQSPPPPPQPGRPTPSSGIETERRTLKKQKQPKRSNNEPELKIFEDETATRDNITQTEDEDFSFALNAVHDFVDAYIRKEGFLYGQEVVDWILPLAKKIDEERTSANGAGLEAELLQWKRDTRRNHWNATRFRDVTTEDWFGAEDVEELGELVERTILTAQEEGSAEVQAFGGNYARGQMRSKALMICGYCQREGFGRETRREAKHYKCLGDAWARVVHYQSDVDIWDMSAERVKNLTWDEEMKKILASEGFIRHLKVLRTRWATTHPLAVGRRPLEERPQQTMGRSLGHRWEEWSFESELDGY